MAENNFKKLTLTSSFDQIEQVEPYLNELKAWAKIEEGLFQKIQLATNEAITNAIIHGNKQDSSKKVWINTRKQNDELEITVKDEGSGFDPSALPDPRSHNQLLKQGGRGVFLIKQYADEVSFEENGTRVRMVFNLNPR